MGLVATLTLEEKIEGHIAGLKAMVREHSASSANGINPATQGMITGLNIAIVSANTWFKEELERRECNGK